MTNRWLTIDSIKASTMRLDHATLEAETGAEVLPTKKGVESRASEDDFEGTKKFNQKLDKTFDFEPIKRGAQS